MTAIISKIKKLSPQNAYNFQGEYRGDNKWITPFDWERPYVKYVNNNSVYLGIDGGPSPIDIWDYKFSWNTKKLKSASAEELNEMYKALEMENNMWERLHEKYGNMNIVEFLNTFAQKANS